MARRSPRYLKPIETDIDEEQIQPPTLPTIREELSETMAVTKSDMEKLIATNESRKLGIIQPTVFSGRSNDNPNNFLSHFEAYSKLTGMEEENKCITFGLLLKDIALCWHQNLGEHIKTDFNKLKEAFKETYMSRSKDWMNVQTLEDRKLEPGEKVESYIADIIKMTNKLGMKDEETRSYIIRGLTPKLKAELITHNPSTLSETIERVYLSEAALKLKNSEIQAIDTNSQIAAITTTIARLDRTINDWNKPRDKIIQNGIQPMNNNADNSTLSRYQRDDHNN